MAFALMQRHGKLVTLKPQIKMSEEMHPGYTGRDKMKG
jgi:hypothetical protein